MQTLARDLAPAAAVQVTADAADGESQRQQRRDRVGQLPAGDIQPPHHEPVEEAVADGAAERGTVEDDAAFPDLEERAGETEDRLVRELVGVLDHVQDASADDAGDEDPDDEVLKRAGGIPIGLARTVPHHVTTMNVTNSIAPNP